MAQEYAEGIEGIAVAVAHRGGGRQSDVAFVEGLGG
jgi:hypothetical protein